MLPTTKQARAVINQVLKEDGATAILTFTDITSKKKWPNRRTVKYWGICGGELGLYKLIDKCNEKLKELGLEETVYESIQSAPASISCKCEMK